MIAGTAEEWHTRARALRYQTGHFIDGEHVQDRNGGRIVVINPATLEPLCAQRTRVRLHRGEVATHPHFRAVFSSPRSSPASITA
jgi:hypothetical protein